MSHFFAADAISDVSLSDQIARFKRMYYKVIDG
jgi:hypothetical protein